ncbi:hypothetical protein JCM5353_007440 [Sporobolomyces roseus]
MSGRYPVLLPLPDEAQDTVRPPRYSRITLSTSTSSESISSLTTGRREAQLSSYTRPPLTKPPSEEQSAIARLQALSQRRSELFSEGSLASQVVLPGISLRVTETKAKKKLEFVDFEDGETPFLALNADKGWSLLKNQRIVANITCDLLQHREVGRITWDKFYTTTFFWKKTTWKSLNGKRYQWIDAKDTNDLRLIDYKTKELLAVVSRVYQASPSFDIVISSLALPSIDLILATHLHQRLKETIRQEEEIQAIVENQDQEDLAM